MRPSRMRRVKERKKEQKNGDDDDVNYYITKMMIFLVIEFLLCAAVLPRHFYRPHRKKMQSISYTFHSHTALASPLEITS